MTDPIGMNQEPGINNGGEGVTPQGAAPTEVPQSPVQPSTLAEAIPPIASEPVMPDHSITQGTAAPAQSAEPVVHHADVTVPLQTPIPGTPTSMMGPSSVMPGGIPEVSPVHEAGPIAPPSVPSTPSVLESAPIPPPPVPETQAAPTPEVPANDLVEVARHSMETGHQSGGTVPPTPIEVKPEGAVLGSESVEAAVGQPVAATARPSGLFEGLGTSLRNLLGMGDTKKAASEVESTLPQGIGGAMAAEQAVQAARQETQSPEGPRQNG